MPYLRLLLYLVFHLFSWVEKIKVLYIKNKSASFYLVSQKNNVPATFLFFLFIYFLKKEWENKQKLIQKTNEGDFLFTFYIKRLNPITFHVFHLQVTWEISLQNLQDPSHILLFICPALK